MLTAFINSLHGRSEHSSTWYEGWSPEPLLPKLLIGRVGDPPVFVECKIVAALADQMLWTLFAASLVVKSGL